MNTFKNSTIKKQKSKAEGKAYFGVAAAFNDRFGEHIVIARNADELKARFPFADESKFYDVAMFEQDDVHLIGHDKNEHI